ncbi:hypothetical protein OAS86_02145 [Gammaproteobacteria bacterium]|nr:hypothetical protein [Gammaproteobacteria bacterium]
MKTTPPITINDLHGPMFEVTEHTGRLTPQGVAAYAATFRKFGFDPAKTYSRQDFIDALTITQGDRYSHLAKSMVFTDELAKQRFMQIFAK